RDSGWKNPGWPLAGWPENINKEVWRDGASQRGFGGLYPRYPRGALTLSGDLRAGCAGSDESRRSVAGDRRLSAVVPQRARRGGQARVRAAKRTGAARAGSLFLHPGARKRIKRRHLRPGEGAFKKGGVL